MTKKKETPALPLIAKKLTYVDAAGVERWKDGDLPVSQSNVFRHGYNAAATERHLREASYAARMGKLHTARVEKSGSSDLPVGKSNLRLSKP